MLIKNLRIFYLFIFVIVFGCSESYKIDDEPCVYDICDPRRPYVESLSGRHLRALQNSGSGYDFYLYNSTGTEIVDTLLICNPLEEGVEFNGELFLVTANIKVECPEDGNEIGVAYLESVVAEPFCTVQRTTIEEGVGLFNTTWKLVGEIDQDNEINYPTCDYIGANLTIVNSGTSEFTGGLNTFKGLATVSGSQIMFQFDQTTTVEGYQNTVNYESQIIDRYFSGSNLSFTNNSGELKVWEETGRVTDTLLFVVDNMNE
ncbi:hypothetical protein [Marinigracilibium pacificum]|uniref:Uncharacterized protein n=1 Tax=Marinigracilibium pacificum TaxID=2729599 RepID=A0A848J175_9BACT|nr:hypothetical protein [Marinigracilibium pacificum]NMM49566.1 hypothetical protein [Marinigracilibium pacificum]